jgi:hypothetical protein
VEQLNSPKLVVFHLLSADLHSYCSIEMESEAVVIRLIFQLPGIDLDLVVIILDKPELVVAPYVRLQQLFLCVALGTVFAQK